MKIPVYGAGVLGCNPARNLFRAGKDVTLLVVMLAVSETTLSIMTMQEDVLQSNVSTETTPMSTEPESVYCNIYF